ncbi:MAG: PBP1A family penicillin-binding protein [Clostridiales bacterium]|nr:PBP1A family penicillin-binding protein [Clostridiales bacterium]
MKLPQGKEQIIKSVLITGGVLAGIVLIVLLVFTVSAFSLDISVLENPLPKPLIVYDKNDVVISERSTVKFTAVPIETIPEVFIDAITSVEDKRFYDHSGVDIRGIIRSLWRNTKAGEIVEGGSTITQQLSKNLFLTTEQTYSRKFKEAITALRIEGKYSKDEILELYLNQIYFGEGVWGIQNAAQMYFGKDIEAVTLEEAALLAALPKAPTIYSPYTNYDKAKERRDLILGLLFEEGTIDQDKYDRAIATDIVLRTKDLVEASGSYPSYVDHVIDEAINTLGLSEEQVLIGGLNIYTTLDPVVQNAIEATYANDALFPESSADELIQSGAIVLDPSTGAIRGLIGYRGQYYYRGYNRATELIRQPGSSIKPLAVYGPALENGYNKNSEIMDEETDFNGYVPNNYDRTFHGKVTLYQALINSYNIPAVAVLNDIGIDKGIAFLESVGIPVHEDDHNLSLALGGMTNGVSPLEMAQAYSIFPNGGVMNTAHSIRKITTNDGNLLAEGITESVIVTTPEVAYAMTDMLMGVINEGTGKGAALDRPVAGKTGTTELPAIDTFEGLSGSRDAWFVGYTPELVTAVWVGYDSLDPSLIMQSSGGSHPASIFQSIMTLSLENIPVSSFEKPKGYKDDPKPDKKDSPGKGKDKKKNN